MRSAQVFATMLVLLLFMACTNQGPVTLGGPSVPDQMKSRGYITTAADTALPDTSGMKVDTLR